MMRTESIFRGSALAVLLAVVGAGCDLDVTNLNEPDRQRALAEPEDMQSLVIGSFEDMWGRVSGGGFATLSATVTFANAGPFNNGSDTYSGVTWAREPRGAVNNEFSIPALTGPHGPRDFWDVMMEVASNAHDGLHQMRFEGARVLEGEGEDELDVTPRLEAYAKFLQGASWGYLALLYDEVIIVDESEPYDEEDLLEQGLAAMVDWPVALEAALDALDEAVSIAEQNPDAFPIPAAGMQWFGRPEAPTTAAEFIQVVNTFAARLLVLSARSPADRAGLDWDRVLAYLDNGVTEDFGPTLGDTAFGSAFYFLGVMASDAIADWGLRMDHRVIGMADTSGEYQNWISLPVLDRRAFEIVTPDRRITGPDPDSHGSVMRYASNDDPWDSAPEYLNGHYQYGLHRNLYGSAFSAGNSSGMHHWLTVEEVTLLRAEALLRTGDLDGAAALINETRTRERVIPGSFGPGTTYDGLPAVTADGVPQSADCVPRTDAGECGDLLVALRYERLVELTGNDLIFGYADMRGFGMLPDGTPTTFPIPGHELEVFGLPMYTTGGGGEHSAVYDPETLD